MRTLNNIITILNTGNSNSRAGLAENFNERIHQERRLEPIVRNMRGQNFEITNANLDSLIQRTNLSIHGRSILDSVPDPIGVAVQQISNWQLGQTASPFFGDVAAATTPNSLVLRDQFSRHVGYNTENQVFNAALNFLTHGSTGSQISSQTGDFLDLRESRGINHFLIFNQLISSGSSQNNVALISFNTFTHTNQSYLDRNQMGSASLFNLRLNTISNQDFRSRNICQQMLTNTVVVPESFLNLDVITGTHSNVISVANPIISRVIGQRINGSTLGVLESSFGKSYLLLERFEQYGLLIDNFKSIQSTLPLNHSFNLGRAITLLQDDLHAFGRGRVTPLLETQISALVLLNSTPSVHHQELIFDNFRCAYADYGNAGNSSGTMD
jgi:hypothetical protein